MCGIQLGRKDTGRSRACTITMFVAPLSALIWLRKNLSVQSTSGCRTWTQTLQNTSSGSWSVSNLTWYSQWLDIKESSGVTRTLSSPVESHLKRPKCSLSATKCSTWRCRRKQDTTLSKLSTRWPKRFILLRCVRVQNLPWAETKMVVAAPRILRRARTAKTWWLIE